jgi:hypothetical protein
MLLRLLNGLVGLLFCTASSEPRCSILDDFCERSLFWTAAPRGSIVWRMRGGAFGAGRSFSECQAKAPPPIRETTNHTGRRTPNKAQFSKVGGFPGPFAQSQLVGLFSLASNKKSGQDIESVPALFDLACTATITSRARRHTDGSPHYSPWQTPHGMRNRHFYSVTNCLG